MLVWVLLSTNASAREIGVTPEFKTSLSFKKAHRQQFFMIALFFRKLSDTPVNKLYPSVFFLKSFFNITDYEKIPSNYTL